MRTKSGLETLWGRKVIKHTKQVAIQVCRRELMQAPRLRLRSGAQFRFTNGPGPIQLVHVLFAAQIKPGQDRPNVTVLLPKLPVRQEHPAIPPGDSCQSKFPATPV